MSREIDNKVVKMSFDNREFESGVSTTLSTLDKLKKALKFDNSNSGLKEVQGAIKGMSFDDLSRSAEYVATKFSTLGIIGVTALQKITNQAIETGEQLVKSLSLDQVTAGWEKYNQETANVQNLMNATGKSEEQVYEYLEKLMWYSDQTSYSYSDMASALSTMVQAGGDVDELMSSIMGMANAVSYAGKGAAEFSSIMQYSVTQAYSKGYMGWGDWSSISSRGVGGEALKEALIAAGEAEGTIKKGVVTAENFVASIMADSAKGMGVDYTWITKDVLSKGLASFADYSDAVYKATEVTGEFEDVYEAMDKLSTSYSDIGVHAFESAQQAKSFQEAIDATKDAVSSGWKDTWRNIFGGYSEAVEQWTELCEELWDIFASTAEYRNEILSEWKDAGGATQLWEGIINILEGIKTVLQPIREAFYDVFNLGTVKEGRDTLLSMTETFQKFTEKLILSEDQMERLRGIFEGVFSVIKSVLDILKSGITVISGAIKLIFEAVKEPLAMALDAIGRFVEGIQGAIADSGILEDVASTLKEKFQSLGEKMGTTMTSVIESITAIVEKAKMFGESALFYKVLPTLIKVYNGVKEVLEKMKEAFDSFVNKVQELFKGFNLDKLIEGLVGGTAITGFLAIITNIVKGITSVKESVTSITDNIEGSFSEIKDTISSLKGVNESLSGAFDTIKTSLQSWQKDLQANTLLKLAAALGILAIALVALSSLDYEKLSDAFAAITGLILELVAATAALNKINIAKKLTGVFNVFRGSSFSVGGSSFSVGGSATTELLKLAAAVLVLAVALKKIGDLEPEQIGMGLISVMGLMASLVVVAQKLNQLGEMEKIAGTIIVFALAITVMAEAFKIFAKLTWQETLVGMLGMVTILGAMWGILQMFDTVSGDLVKTGAGLIIVAEAIKILAESVTMLGANADNDGKQLIELYTGLSAVFILLMSMGAFVKLVQGSEASMAAIGAGMLIIAAAVLVLSGAVKLLSTIDIETLSFDMAALIVMLAALGVAVTMVQDNLAGAATLVVAAAAILVLSVALTALGLLPEDRICNALIVVAGAIMVLIVAAYAAEPIVGPLLAVAAAFLILAAALVVAGAGINLIGTGLVSLGAGIAAIAASILVAITSIVKSVQALVVGVVNIVTSFRVAVLNAITETINTIITNIASIISTIASAIGEILLSVTNVVVEAINNLNSVDMSSLANAITVLVLGLGTLVTAVLLMLPTVPVFIAVAAGIGVFTAALAALVVVVGVTVAGIYVLLNLFPALKATIESIIDAFGRFIDRVTEGYDHFTDRVADLIGRIADFLEGIGDTLESLGDRLVGWASNAGEMIISGLVKGIEGAAGMVVSAVTRLANWAKDKFKETLGIASPSKVFKKLGNYIDEGLAIGIKDGTDGVTASVSKVASGLTSTFQNEADGFYNLGATFGDNLASGIQSTASTATITPVIDVDSSSLQNAEMFTRSISDSMARMNDISTDQTLEEHVTFDTLRVEGVNNEGEFVGAANYAVDEVLSALLRREARR